MLQDLLARFGATYSDRRLARRCADMPGTISFAGSDYPVKDISQRGFAVKRYGAEHYPGDRVRVSVKLGDDDDSLVFDCDAVVTWVNRRTRELAGAFLELDPAMRRRISDSIPEMTVAK